MAVKVNYKSWFKVFSKVTVGDLFKTLFLVVMDLVMKVVGIPICAIGLLFCNKESEHMPKLFWLFDNDVDTINGDEGEWVKVIKRTWWLGKRTSYWTRFWWCAIRNSARNYTMWVGVRPCDVKEIWVNKAYDESVSHHYLSLLVIAVTEDGKRYVMWHPSWRVWLPYFGHRILLGKYGFKLWDIVGLAEKGEKEKRQFVYYPSLQKI